LAAAILATSGRAAIAADQRVRLDIRKPTAAETLIELGIRMGVSLGGVEACKGPGVPLIGPYTLK
jgi:iron complex outermembrane recepter protein